MGSRSSVLKPIFEFSYQIKIQKIENELKNAILDKNQKALKRAFFKAITTQRVVFMGLDERTKLVGEDTKATWLKATLQAYLKLGLGRNNAIEAIDFKVLDDRVWAINRDTQRPLGVTVETYQEAGGWLQRLVDFFDPRQSSTERLEKQRTVKSNGANMKCSEIFRGLGL